MSIIHVDRPFGDWRIGDHEMVGPDNERLAEADAAIVGVATWDAARFDLAPKLRVLARTGIGVDAVNLAEATRRGVMVTNTPEGPTVSTAEHAITLMLALAKTVNVNAQRLRDQMGNYSIVNEARELDGQTLGLLGYGRIAKRVARIAAGIGMEVLAHDPFVWDVDAHDQTQLVSFDDLLARSHVLSLHAPLVDDTADVMNATTLAACRQGVILINCARGGLVDHDALVAALDSGHVWAAGLDVTKPEPLPRDHTLLHRPNVIVTPHIASTTTAGRQRMLDMAAEQVEMALAGQRPSELVNTDWKHE